MIDVHDSKGASSPLDSFCPKSKGVVSAYLLECQLKRVLAKNELDFSVLQDKTGLSLMHLERAIYDQIYRLDAGQLSQALQVYQDNGWAALVVFLHHPQLSTIQPLSKAA